jgi:hypothetical protein
MNATDIFKDTVLDAIAQLLPYSPRDFTVDVQLTPSNTGGRYKASVSIVALTAMGLAIKPVLQKQLSAFIARTVQQQGGTYVLNHRITADDN